MYLEVVSRNWADVLFSLVVVHGAVRARSFRPSLEMRRQLAIKKKSCQQYAWIMVGHGVKVAQACADIGLTLGGRFDADVPKASMRPPWQTTHPSICPIFDASCSDEFDLLLLVELMPSIARAGSASAVDCADNLQ